MPKSISSNEKKWQAEDDASSLKRYAEIQSDRGRMSAANKCLEKQMKETSMAMGMIKMPTKMTAQKTTPKKSIGNIKSAMMQNNMKPMSKGKK